MNENNENNNENNNNDPRSVTERLFAFTDPMDRSRSLLGWCYLPIHVFVLPLLLNVLSGFSAVQLSETNANLLYYVIGLIVLLPLMWPYLRDGFNRFLDAPGRCLFSMLIGLALTYLFSNLAAALLLLLTEDLPDNPNNAAVLDLAQYDYGTVRAIALFLAPIVEEILFRGVVFGSLRGKSRAAAYGVSVLLFALYHVWQPALVLRDASVLIYALQYIPVTVGICRIYERSGSIWACIFFHMGFNAVSFSVLGM